ncbi:MAG: hemolysin family protein [Anaerolineae bacterium]|nr:hemolysin family protein [Anaerolineae bacterium]
MFEILAWFVCFLIVGMGSVWYTVATLAREVSSLRVAQAARVNRARTLSSVLTLLGVVGATMLAVVLSARASGNVTMAAWGAAGAVLLARGVQVLARVYARRNIERLALPLLGDAVVFLPLVEAREGATTVESPEEVVEQMVDASEKAGLIESDERAMISGILQLDRTLTREIMVPRIDVVAVEVETPLRDALDVVIQGAHSRLPVYEESIDRIVGLLYAKDLLRTLRDGKVDVSLRELMRPAYFVPESKRVDELLQELQRDKVHMAIVVDEFGGTAGIVTIEDVLEEIVGEIQDEYDTGEEPLIEQVSENEGIFNARATIGDVNDALALDLPDESDTLGGLVYQRLEKLPKVGDQVRVGNVTIEVLNVIGRRIKKVRVARVVDSEQ